MNAILPIIAIGISIIGVLYQHFVVMGRFNERLTRLETKVELFWMSIERSIAPLIKSYPTCVDKDVLLDKMSRRELLLEEAFRLRTILTEEAKRDREKAIAYALYVARLEVLIEELKRKAKK